MVLETEVRLDWPDTVSVVETVVVASCETPVKVRFVPVAFVKVRPARVERPDTFKLPPWRYPDAVRLVLDTAAKLDWPEMLIDAPWREPEAVRLVEETVANVDCPETVRYPFTL